MSRSVLLKPHGDSMVPVATTRTTAGIVLGVIGVALVLGGLWVAWTLGFGHQGLSRLANNDFVGATGSFERAENGAPIERWVSPYNQGVAWYRAGHLDRSAAEFERADSVVPDAYRCQVRLNWSFVLTAGADEALAADDPDAAMVRLTQGRDILADAMCESEDDKQQQQNLMEDIEQKMGATQQRPNPAEDPPPTEEQEKELEQRNQEAERKRQEAEDQSQTEDTGSDTEPNPSRGGKQTGKTW